MVDLDAYNCVLERNARTRRRAAVQPPLRGSNDGLLDKIADAVAKERDDLDRSNTEYLYGAVLPYGVPAGGLPGQAGSNNKIPDDDYDNPVWYTDQARLRAGR